jgi:ABC-type glycerol-3-phosphate transport system substrate-binding protein
MRELIQAGVCQDITNARQSAALEYEKANPAVKIEFDYLENEEFKAKLPTLLQSKVSS